MPTTQEQMERRRNELDIKAIDNLRKKYIKTGDRKYLISAQGKYGIDLDYQESDWGEQPMNCTN